MNPSEMHDLLEQAMKAAAARITGDPACPPRPGQLKLAHDTLTAMLGGPNGPGHLAGCAPTGVGKSLGVGVPAFLMAAMNGDRTIVSTESKALQAQLVSKDYPLIASVVKDLTGVPVDFAIHKGFANYACGLQAEAVAVELAKLCGVDLQSAVPEKRRKTVKTLAGPAEVEAAAVTMLELLDDPVRSAPLDGDVLLDRRAYPGRALANLARWALTETVSGENGDRSEYVGEAPDNLWRTVSVQPDECIGTNCPLYDMCPAQRARNQAHDAQIVVTNHTLLALQASLAVPVVLSNRKLGLFSHLIVDEAHALPSTVRSTGSRQLSSRRIGAANRAFKDIFADAGVGQIRRVADQGSDLAQNVDMLLGSFLIGKGDTAPYTLDRHPLLRIAHTVDSWVKAAKSALPSEGSVSNARAQLRIRRANNALTSIAEDLAESMNTERQYARWVEADRDGNVSLRFSPVDVAPGISANLFLTADPETKEQKEARKESGDPPPPKRPLSVTMVSATLPPGFSREAGVRSKVVDYESPFDAAYGSSMLYVPRLLAPAELDEVGTRNPNGRTWRFDTFRHPEWATSRIIDLVRANGGRALVLAATAKAGQLYADALRAAFTGHTIFSQWDGLDARQVVDAWRADETSVLVGTRSMMTGVDAAGDTCSLVVIDRAPRNPQNVVDEARAESLMDDAGMDKWAADRAVYVSDAALLLEQASGRLIRSTTDSGLVAVLDPRLMKGTPISYPESTRAVYMSALRRFRQRSGDMEVALGFLAARQGVLEAV